jgi:hypothetical protein
MLTATCHCKAVKVEVPRAPESVTDCNCSICRRYAVLWAYYNDAEVTLTAAPDVDAATDDYVWGEKTQKFIRCKRCGCVMQWKKFVIDGDTWTGVNARNFDPPIVGKVPVRLLDGADTWEYLS